MQIKSGKLLFSPHDLMAFLEGPFVSWMERFDREREKGDLPIPWPGITAGDLKPDETSPEMKLIIEKGRAHESDYVKGLGAADGDLCDLSAQKGPEATLAAMKAGRKIIYQACLAVDPFLGYPDFLCQAPGDSVLGPWHYRPQDTKLALSAKPAFIVQLCAYCDMLETLQACRPAQFSFVFGDGKHVDFTTDEFFFYYRRLRQAMLAFHERFDPAAPPDPGADRTFGRWSELAGLILEQTDHLRQVARITLSQVKKLNATDIKTLTALAKTKRQEIPRLPADTFARLRRQAALQLESRGLAKPTYVVVPPAPELPRRGLGFLPPPSPNDVFFDMEGFPHAPGGLEYLFGAVYLQNGKPAFKDWWAHDDIQERKAFEAFIDWVFGRWTADKTLHIYHYAAYETTAMRRLMGKFASREREVDDLLRNHVFVDLYTVVCQGLVIGTPGYSLKDIECLYMPPRAGAVVTASGSVVAYQEWLESGQSPDWRQSPILREIRDYNEVDCESLRQLRDWLVREQKKAGIAYAPPPEKEEKDDAAAGAVVHPSTLLCRQLLDEVATGKPADPERRRVQELLAWLLEFHWREAKPVFWRMFARNEMTEQELYDDFDCLAGLQRTGRAPQPAARSRIFEYRFDPDQDTKLDEESRCFYAHDLGQRTEIISIDTGKGLVAIKLSNNRPAPPDRLSLIPDEHVSADIIAKAVYRYVEAWHNGQSLSRAVDDLLDRHPPRINVRAGGPIIDPGGELLGQVTDTAARMDHTTLCIQGPPGTGKTYTIGHVIASLLAKGKRIGVTANSHKAILNVLEAVHKACAEKKVAGRLYKAGGDEVHALLASGQIAQIDSRDVAGALADTGVVVGGTAWAFSRDELEQQLDYLFIDEAGQFSLANVVAVGMAAKNLILVGDQMQLSQPVQGSHPGESGQSGLDYLLNGHQTIPPEFGVFLNMTRRLHPEICRLISDAVYEGRLEAHADTGKRRIIAPTGAKLVDRGTGVLFVPVEHEGNTQCSDEEVDAVAAIMKELLSGKLDDAGKRRGLSHRDILLVAPYNMQVRRLYERLGPSAQIASVDKFQGLQAPVVIVSMCASSLEECPRGAEFLLSRNRLNVAISRAQCLAIVVGSPALMTARCHTVEQMKLVNFFCRIVDYAEWLPTPAPR